MTFPAHIARRAADVLLDKRREVRDGDEAGGLGNGGNRPICIAEQPKRQVQLFALDERRRASQPALLEDAMQIRPADVERVAEIPQPHDALRQVRANLPDRVKQQGIAACAQIVDDRDDQIGQIPHAGIMTFFRLVQFGLHQRAERLDGLKTRHRSAMQTVEAAEHAEVIRDVAPREDPVDEAI